MVSAYMFSIGIISHDTAMSEDLFRQQVAPYPAHLDAMMGAFERKPCMKTYHRPNQNDNRWSMNATVTISVGKKRAPYLLKLYESLFRLIELEAHPSLELRASIHEIPGDLLRSFPAD